MFQTPELDRARLLRARAASQLLTAGDAEVRDALATVEWFGAQQGQDLASVLWSVGLRTGLTRAQLDDELETGRIVRTWPMRGTLHLVPGADAAWMVRHLGSRALAGAARRRSIIGLHDQDAERAIEVLDHALSATPLLTRSAAIAALSDAGIDTSGQHAYHILWFVSQSGLTCVGPQRDGEQTFARLADWAPKGPDLGRDEALAVIAERFVRSHGPASPHDLARWADLTVTDARSAIRSVPELLEVTHDGRTLWATEDALAGADAATVAVPARALPGFDEFVLGYRDRTAQLDAEHERTVVPGGNGMFANTLVVDGRVVGTWRRRALTKRVVITANPFAPLGRSTMGDLEEHLTRYADHLGLAAEISWAV